MRNWLSLTLLTLGWVAFVACGGGTSDGPPKGSGGSGGSGGGLTCETLADPPDACNDPCGGDGDCGAGTFCLSGSCAAQCTSDDDCNVNASCSASGRCIPDMSMGGNNGFGGGNGCQSVTITPDFTIPNVMFLVDQSGSMVADFGDPDGDGPLPVYDRWESAHYVINNIVGDLQSVVRFGLTTYTSRNGFQEESPGNPRDCPRLPTQVGFALDNASAISSQYPQTYPTDAGEDTPTGDSIDALVSWIQEPENTPPNDGPTIIVLATDGLPDSCECADNWPTPVDTSQNYCEGPPTPTDPRIEAVNAAARAHEPPPAGAGIDVYPLWVGNLSNDAQRQHMQAVADAGVAGTGTVWVGDNPQALEDSFRAIIAESISCDIPMLETFADPAAACAEGDVRLDGASLACVGAGGDGWRVKPGDDQVIELLGTACDTLKTGDVEFSASFPCGSVIVD